MQRINLFSPDMLPKRAPMDFRRALLIVPIFLLFMAVVVWWQKSVLNDEQTRTNNARDDLDAVLTQIAELSQQLPSTPHIVDIPQLQQQLQERQAFLAQLQQKNTIQKGFSPVLKQLSDAAVTSIWLTDIHADAGTLILKGETLTPDKMPDWLVQLQNGPSDQSLQFSQLKLQRLDNKPVLAFSVNGAWQR
jgi:Tfp pilus assembly protein PilN